ncbi:unnamed protein product [Symbiodinium pilosum]|uniref:Uncharacterized protein n=1 Tax=Symbiodinium pilosum TaxID=2952 RepID=A0A812KPM7_SYMPI|nr:unnamed protein product [Symbiodinium pilosum]
MRSLEPFCGDVACRVFCILLVKEPHFWLKSCSRELRNFFEIRPFEGPQRREMPAQQLSQLLGSLEHDCVTYENALQLWNDTVRSYMDDGVYPADQAVIVRCEDFLFSFHEVMTTLGQLGQLEELSASVPEPIEERAKGHKECRTRGEALDFYGNPKNLKAREEQSMHLCLFCVSVHVRVHSFFSTIAIRRHIENYCIAQDSRARTAHQKSRAPSRPHQTSKKKPASSVACSLDSWLQ